MLLIGPENGDHIRIEIAGRERPEDSDFWDGNWLVSSVKVQAGAWSGSFRALLRAEEFEQFLSQTEQLYKDLEGTAEFIPMEPWIIVKLTGNKLGQIAVEGEACDKVGIGNTLKFHLQIDQTYLPAIITSLKKIIREYPVIGRE